MEILHKNILHLCQKANISLPVLAKEIDFPQSRLLPSRQGFQHLPALIKIANKFEVSIDNLLHKDFSIADKLLAGKDLLFLSLDVDGVMTDGGMYYSEAGKGDEFKKFYAKDGIGIMQLKKKNFPMGIISSGINENLIKRRAALLGIQHVHAGKVPKNEVLNKWCTQLNMEPSNVISSPM